MQFEFVLEFLDAFGQEGDEFLFAQLRLLAYLFGLFVVVLVLRG